MPKMRNYEEVLADLYQFLDPQTGRLPEYAAAMLLCTATLQSMGSKKWSREEIAEAAEAGAAAIADYYIQRGGSADEKALMAAHRAHKAAGNN
jgi:hypothetical protein